MNASSITNIAASIVTVALVTTIVSHPETAGVIRSIGSAFSEALRASMGR